MRVFIDGENFRKGITDVLKSAGSISKPRDLVDYDLRLLLEDVLANADLDVAYYASKIKLPNGYEPQPEVMEHVEIIREHSRAWVANLDRQGVAYVKAGYLKAKSTKPCRSCGKAQDILQEKGVDVKVATDIIEHSFTSSDVPIVLFSSDSDLIPALNAANTRGVRIIYVCFADRINCALSSTANETVSIPTEKAKKYLIAAEPPSSEEAVGIRVVNKQTPAK